MAKGDVVLITFPFTDLSGSKFRPAVVLSENSMDYTVCFITSQIGWQEQTDLLLYQNSINGLKRTSLIRTSKIATLDKNLIQGLLGKLSKTEVIDLNYKLKILLQIP
ncbi:type II toxin-antitoxin system PemK/MazF family toxin [Pedobacter glucosidilyticus]|uniref:type II toxin-antitoxin system PemK/MazF family toxin n=1 Tax=Pedobacter glucosidilyticus TaxID=1122941 RepID=UPI0026F22A7A|nr:type II toxin-antitoxin system PemK/MazF family toxin [Pedobacter glucosidilyticus]